MKARRFAPPIALQILALMLGGLIVAQLVTLALTLLLPPPPPVRHDLNDIARALQGARIDTRGARPMVRTIETAPPSLRSPGWMVSERSREELAALLGVSQADVRIVFYAPLPFAGASGPPALPPVREPPRAETDTAAGLLVKAVYQGPAGGPPPGGGFPGGGLPGGSLPGGGPPGGGFPGGGFPGGGFPGGGIPGGRFPGGGMPSGAPTGQPTARAPAPPQSTTPAPRPAAPPTVSAPSAQPTVGTPRQGTPPVSPRSASSGQPPDPAPGPLSASAGPQPGGAPQPAGAGPPPTEGQPGPANHGGGAPPPNAGAAPGATPSAAPVLAPQIPSSRSVDRSRSQRSPAPAAVTPAPSIADAAPRIVPATPIAPEQSGPAVAADALAFSTDAAAETAPVASADGRTLPAPVSRGLFGLAPAPMVEGDFVAALRMAPNRWITVQPKPEAFPNSWQRRVLLWFAIAFAVVGPLGYLFARRLARPLADFARAAEQLGRDPSADVVASDGPAEVGRAARAFNTMQSRLRRYVDDRTAMISAISHDLRTPLARMRFRLERAPPSMRAAMDRDLSQMEAMISSVLVFMRDGAEGAPRQRVDLRSIVECAVDDAAAGGGEAELEAGAPADVTVDVLAVQRVFENLIDNALKYGHRARLRLYTDAEDAVVEIADEGPGLPDAELDRVFLPFYRAKDAERSAAKGMGLGLAVARSSLRAHGGDVVLRSSSSGLIAEVRLPLAGGKRDATRLAA